MAKIKDIPIKGQRYSLKSSNGDPFKPKKTTSVKILDVKDGWIKYYMSRIFDDNRKPLEDFLAIYELDNS